MSESTSVKRERPLSPHLQVYRLPLTAKMSIFFRACGVALSIGTLMVVWWLVAAATGEEAYNTAMRFAQSPLGIFMIFGWSFALYYHLCNGVRHLFWDTGAALGKQSALKAGYVVLVAAIVLTASTWICVTNFHTVSIPKPMANTLAQLDGAE